MIKINYFETIKINESIAADENFKACTVKKYDLFLATAAECYEYFSDSMYRQIFKFLNSLYQITTILSYLSTDSIKLTVPVHLYCYYTSKIL